MVEGEGEEGRLLHSALVFLLQFCSALSGGYCAKTYALKGMIPLCFQYSVQTMTMAAHHSRTVPPPPPPP